MSRRRGKLRAELDATRERVLCGHCGARIAYIVTDPPGSANVAGWEELAAVSEALHPGSVTRTGQQLPRYAGRRVRFDAGWTPTKEGVWVLPASAEKRPPGLIWHHSSPSSGEPHALPVEAECAGCGARQELDASTLRVSERPPHPSGDYRYVKVGARPEK